MKTKTMNTNENKIIYVLIVDVKHGDLYDMQEDGSTVIGVYDDRNLAERRLVSEYEQDKKDLLGGSCRPDGDYEITEDNPLKIIENTEYTAYAASASLVVSEKSDGSFDREFLYYIAPKTLNRD